MKQITLILTFCTLTLSVFCQFKSKFPPINEIDFLNLKGTFYKYDGELYISEDSLKFGIIGKYYCGVFYRTKIGEDAFSYNQLIATNLSIDNILTINYDSPVYIKFKNKSFHDFLKENTKDGMMVPKEQLRINGKKPKLYCEQKRNKKNNRLEKLSKRCN